MIHRGGSGEWRRAWIVAGAILAVGVAPAEAS